MYKILIYDLRLIKELLVIRKGNSQVLNSTHNWPKTVKNAQLCQQSKALLLLMKAAKNVNKFNNVISKETEKWPFPIKAGPSVNKSASDFEGNLAIFKNIPMKNTALV